MLFLNNFIFYFNNLIICSLNQFKYLHEIIHIVQHFKVFLFKLFCCLDKIYVLKS